MTVWGIILFLLKLIGYLLLGVLGIILLVLLLVLFTPLVYRLEGEKFEKALARFRVSWFLGGLQVAGSYQENDMSFGVRVLGIQVFPRKEKKRSKGKREASVPISARERGSETDSDAKPPEKTKPIEMEVIKTEDRPLTMGQAPTEHMGMDRNEPEPEVEKTIEEATSSPTAGQIRRIKLSDYMPKEEPDISEEPQKEEPKLEESIAEDEDTSFAEENGKSQKEKLDLSYFIHMEDKDVLLRAVDKLLRRLLRGVAPRDLTFSATIGTGDPAATGLLLGLVGIGKARFGKNLSVKGDFSAMDFRDAKGSIRGRIYFSSLIGSMISFLLTKPVRRMIKVYWKGTR